MHRFKSIMHSKIHTMQWMLRRQGWWKNVHKNKGNSTPIQMQGENMICKSAKWKPNVASFAEERKEDPVQRMHDYALNVTKDEAEDDEDIQAKEDMDVAMIQAVLRDYKAA
eukprot:338885_1